MNRLNQKLATSVFLAVAPSLVFADQVRLFSADGAISITGELLSFDDTTYTVETVVGTVELSRALAQCEGEACPPVPRSAGLSMSVSGPETSELAQQLLKSFATTQNLATTTSAQEGDAGVQIELVDTATSQQSGTAAITVSATDEGLAQLVGGGADIYVSTDAAVVAGADGTGLPATSTERVVALDALVPIVHPDNPVASVSLESLAQIAAGRIQNWSELGGNDAPIRMLLPAEGSALDRSFAALILDPNRVRLRRSAERAESEAQATTTVLEDVNAITVTTLAGRGEAQVLPILQSCGPLAHASDFAIKAEEYPLSKRVYAYTVSTAQPPFKAGFLDYISSPDAQELIENTSYVSQAIATQAVEFQGTRMMSAILSASTPQGLALVQTLARDVAQADRLSTTFRFTSASSELDSKSLSDLQRMVTFLTSEQAAGRDILVVGFSDDVGRFDLNERLSLLRATSVRDALAATPGGAGLLERISISAYGPLAPVGCNDTPSGRESNRRVEIWLK